MSWKSEYRSILIAAGLAYCLAADVLSGEQSPVVKRGRAGRPPAPAATPADAPSAERVFPDYEAIPTAQPATPRYEPTAPDAAPPQPSTDNAAASPVSPQQVDGKPFLKPTYEYPPVVRGAQPSVVQTLSPLTQVQMGSYNGDDPTCPDPDGRLCSSNGSDGPMLSAAYNASPSPLEAGPRLRSALRSMDRSAAADGTADGAESDQPAAERKLPAWLEPRTARRVKQSELPPDNDLPPQFQNEPAPQSSTHPPVESIEDIGTNLASGSAFDGCNPGCTNVYQEECDACCPRCCWYFRGDVMFLNRNQGRDQPLTSAGVNGPIVLTKNSPQFNPRPVTSLLIGRELPYGGLLEGSYFGLTHWNATAVAADPNSRLFSAFNQFGTNPAPGPLPNTDSARLAVISRWSHLFDTQLNVLTCGYESCCWGDIRLLTGFRFLNITEGFDYSTVTARGAGFSSTRTANNLIGWQFGARWEVGLTQRISFTVDGKFGAYGNAGSMNYISNVPPGGPIGVNINNLRGAFLADLAPVMRFHLTDYLTFRAGYYVLYAGGLALASENFTATLPPVPTVINMSGTGVYHGVTLGLEYQY